ncbi:hypothetical protein [Streptomyces sp. NPDC051554]|uniref:hypothetical protein n=1 Tax=Streptomyces sp. NPDC051554 TaxID=3365656 RepID=UPI003798CD18
MTRRLPRSDEPDLLATVRRAGTARPPTAPHLYDALCRRRSSRFPFADRPAPASVLTELTEAAHAEGSVLDLPGPRRPTSCCG